WQTTLNLVQDPTYVSWNYTMRSSDGMIWQHLKPNDVGWHAGNWYVNMHSIGIEREGFAAQGATWYTEALYRNSAKLVRHLAAEYDVPLDRAHIIGHDKVPGPTPSRVRGMHWDPGPYWDWEHYFDLLGAPFAGLPGTPKVGTAITLIPGFDDNRQPVTGCDATGTCPSQGTNFVYLRSAPDDDAPLVGDLGLHPDGTASTTHVSDIGARIDAGSKYVVADRSGDWLAVWYLGRKGWFRNPAADPDAYRMPSLVVKPKAGMTSVPVYGRAYPEQAAYPAEIPYTGNEITPLQYTIGAGQSYPLADATLQTDYYAAKTYDGAPPNDHVQVIGDDRYYEIWFGHRMFYVRAADVDISFAW
ncbi:MAG TPA: N-acetylmuramoyl-L-alanine amidase, partial [Kribbellaceae bacterium]|nr:N-acetylmuramoyl-L-alanine amidase [Kribbellaceae bacterium]